MMISCLVSLASHYRGWLWWSYSLSRGSKGIVLATLADVCALSAVEFISISQQVLDISSEDTDVWTSLSDIDWQEQQSTDPLIARFVTIVKVGHKLISRQSSHESVLVRQNSRELKISFLKNDVLYRNGTVSGQQVVQLAVPTVFPDIFFCWLRAVTLVYMMQIFIHLHYFSV